jgi:hypothetical protein
MPRVSSPSHCSSFGFDERTVAQWQARAGEHCQDVHRHLVQQGQVELGQVQADELWVKLVGKRIWMVMALAVPFSTMLPNYVSNECELKESYRTLGFFAYPLEKVYSRNYPAKFCWTGTFNRFWMIGIHIDRLWPVVEFIAALESF